MIQTPGLLAGLRRMFGECGHATPITAITAASEARIATFDVISYQRMVLPNIREASGGSGRSIHAVIW